jgi:transposase-like protein
VSSHPQHQLALPLGTVETGGFGRAREDLGMLAVADAPAQVEARLLKGHLRCPSCLDSALGPWGFARERELRGPSGRQRVRFRRTRCRACHATHVLVPTSTLLRRLDLVEVIGAALLAMATGQGHRRIAAALGLPATTVRGWLRRFSRRAAGLRALAAQLANRYDAELGPIAPRGSPTADAVEALGVAAAAVVRRFGQLRSTPWQVISALTDTLMLSTAPLPER